MNTNLDTFNESSLFVIPAELTNRIDNLVHIPDGHSVHLPVKFIEIRFDFIVVILTAKCLLGVPVLKYRECLGQFGRLVRQGLLVLLVLQNQLDLQDLPDLQLQSVDGHLYRYTNG